MMEKGKVLVLRSCEEDLTSYHGFQWPESGYVEAPDWVADGLCGRGLHGFLWGKGEGGLANWSIDAKWLVVEVEETSVMDVHGKVKFPRGNVVFCGSRIEATNFIKKHTDNRNIVGSTEVAGDRESSLSGYRGISVSGRQGGAEAGDMGVALTSEAGTSKSGFLGRSISGDEGIAQSDGYGVSVTGEYGISHSGDGGRSISDHSGRSTSGHRGMSFTACLGTSKSGQFGTSIAGYSGKAMTGSNGISIAGIGGCARSGERGVIVITYFDHNGNRIRAKTGHVGEDGILPDVWYRLNQFNEFEVCDEKES